MTGRLVVVGDAMLDRDVAGTVRRVCPDAPVPVVEEVDERLRPGGAALAACLAARAVADASLDLEVVLVTSLGTDGRAAALRRLLAAAGVEVVALRRHGPTLEKARVRANGQSLIRLDSGRRGDAVEAPGRQVMSLIADAHAVLVADYAAGVTAVTAVREAVAGTGRSRRPLVWDPHPDGPEPVPGAWLLTPNEEEAAILDARERAGVVAGGRSGRPNGGRPGAGGQPAGRLARVSASGRRLVGRWQARSVAVTLGRDGALLVEGGQAPLLVPAEPATGDTCGAGDCLAATAVVALATGAVPSEALAGAVAAAGRYVAAGGAVAWSTPTADDGWGGDGGYGRPLVLGSAGSDAVPVRPAPARGPAVVGLRLACTLVGDVRSSGGVVVATGGCFDLLHAGHVAVLRAARRLGDCLVVCLNSDASVRRLKGPGRPLQCADDRTAVLASLSWVDAVVVFDEDTPVEVLRGLRPELFAKGGDYALGTLPEEAALASWGGQVVLLPYLAGRSTTALVEGAARQASG